MDRESFLEAVRKHFANDIQEIYRDCENHSDRGFDLARMNRLFRSLWKGARAQGIGEKDFLELIRTTIPDHWQEVDLSARSEPGAKQKRSSRPIRASAA
jgi:hypothetical protein